jgi:hypothetical protein
MLHVFHLDVVKIDQDIAHVAMVIYVCCKYMFQMFQRFSEVYCKCVFQMFQLFHLNVAYVVVIIHICCKCVFQMFYLFQTYVAVSIHIYSKRMFAMFHLVSDVCRSKWCSHAL